MTDTTRHEDELFIEDALVKLCVAGRARVSDGSVKRMRYALEGALLALTADPQENHDH